MLPLNAAYTQKEKQLFGELIDFHNKYTYKKMTSGMGY